MDRCANTEVLNKYLSGEEQFEKVCEDFWVWCTTVNTRT